MISLLFDTSNQALSIAINKDKALVAEINTNYKKTHSETLLENISKILEISSLKKSNIDRIIVARGPGSYTGLRIAVTIAKMLSKGLNIPLYSVSSLFVLAASEKIDGSVTALIDARRGHVYSASYNFKGNQVVVNKTPSYEKFIEKEQTSYVINEAEKKTIDIEIFTNVTPRISRVEQFEDMLVLEDADTFIPDYLRISEAEKNWQDKQK